MDLSVINIAAVSDRVNLRGVAPHREQDGPVTRAQPYPGGTLSAFTSPIPDFANAFSLVSICARVVAMSLRNWRTAADVNSISFMNHSSHNAIKKSN
jgi:hypothetical protein